MPSALHPALWAKLKLSAHADKRAIERTTIKSHELRDLRVKLKSLTLDPKKEYYVDFGGRGYAAIGPTKRDGHVLTTVLAPYMKPRGQQLKMAEVIAHIAGPSGAGKTTLLRALAGKDNSLVVKDLDEFREEARAYANLKDVPSKTWTPVQRTAVRDDVQRRLDNFIVRHSGDRVVFSGHHTAPSVLPLRVPTDNKYLLNTSAAESAQRRLDRGKKDGTSIPERKLEQYRQDGEEIIAYLTRKGYTPLSSDQILAKLQGNTKTAVDWASLRKVPGLWKTWRGNLGVTKRNAPVSRREFLRDYGSVLATDAASKVVPPVADISAGVAKAVGMGTAASLGPAVNRRDFFKRMGATGAMATKAVADPIAKHIVSKPAVDAYDKVMDGFRYLDEVGRTSTGRHGNIGALNRMIGADTTAGIMGAYAKSYPVQALTTVGKGLHKIGERYR